MLRLARSLILRVCVSVRLSALYEQSVSVYIQLITKSGKKQLCELNERKPVKKYAKKLPDIKGRVKKGEEEAAV